MSVVDLDAHRHAVRPARCVCGSEWFTLHGHPTNGPDYGAVTLSNAGQVTGYCGETRCAECDAPWVSPDLR
jgi:hypothetical protein